ncbi:unnamed protein product [Diamesa hyperborea]
MSANRVCEALDQQEKLKEMKEKLKGVMEKINQSINSITVEEFHLNNTLVNELSDDDEDIEFVKPTCKTENIKQERKLFPQTSQSCIIQTTIPMDQSQVNKQPIDLDQTFDLDFEEDSDEEFCT